MPSAEVDRAVAEGIEHKLDVIEARKVVDRRFLQLLKQNYELWRQIQRIQNGLDPRASAVMETLETRRRLVLDELAARIERYLNA